MYIYTVTFENSRGEERVLNEVMHEDAHVAYERAVDIIKQFCDEHAFHIYYIIKACVPRRNIELVERCDVGSWSEFFYIYPTSRDAIDKDIRKRKRGENE